MQNKRRFAPRSRTTGRYLVASYSTIAPADVIIQPFADRHVGRARGIRCQRVSACRGVAPATTPATTPWKPDGQAWRPVAQTRVRLRAPLA